MSGPPVKRVRFVESHTEAGSDAPNAVHQLDPKNTGSRTIDSDEEEPGEDPTGEGGRLTEDCIEGQEEATITNDNGIAITPFNLREEMQEGYFDSAGCYIFKKEDNDIHDNWLDNVDWESVKQPKTSPGTAAATGEGSDSDGSGEDLGAAELARLCATARSHLAPGGETVAGAIKRLGGGTNRALTASQRLRLKKSGGAPSAADDAVAAANRQRMLELSELAGRLVSAGHMAVYQMDARQLARLGGLSDKGSGAAAGGTAASGSGASVDMFASDDEVDIKDESAGAKKDSAAVTAAESDGVTWLYRITDSPTSEVLGPFNSSQMLDWSQSDHGWPGGHQVVFVRKRDAPDSAAFYSSARIDFDLYV